MLPRLAAAATPLRQPRRYAAVMMLDARTPPCAPQAVAHAAPLDITPLLLPRVRYAPCCRCHVKIRAPPAMFIDTLNVEKANIRCTLRR